MASDGFFARHPRLTMNLVGLSMLAGSVGWIVRALQSGNGMHGATIESSPTIFWIEIIGMTVIAVCAMVLSLRVAMKTVCWSRKSRGLRASAIMIVAQDNE